MSDAAGNNGSDGFEPTDVADSEVQSGPQTLEESGETKQPRAELDGADAVDFGSAGAASETIDFLDSSGSEDSSNDDEDEEDDEDSRAVAIEQADESDSDTPFEKLSARAKRFSEERIRTILESLLFITDKPLSKEAMRACTGIELADIDEQLHKLQGFYRDGIRGIVLHQVGAAWQFRTCASTSEFVRRFLRVKPQRLTRAALETLAIIAYRQPVTRPEIEDVRAVDSGAVIKALLDRRLIKIVGKKDEVGRPLLYGTTPEFLEFFNLGDLSCLPTLREFQELTEENQKIVEQETKVPTTDGMVEALRDNAFEEKLKATHAEADAALADLETAMVDTEQAAKQAARLLEPEPTDAGANDGSGAPTVSGSVADKEISEEEQSTDAENSELEAVSAEGGQK